MDHQKRLIDALAPLCEPLYDVLTTANTQARRRHPEFCGDPDLGSVLTHVVRGLALHGLRERDLAPWKMVPRNNAGISLSAGSHNVRVLHQMAGKSVPPPGPNLVRRRFYANATLDPVLFPEGDNLLALWSEDGAGALTIRVVRPIGSWSFGGRHRVDLDFTLPSMAADLESLTFDTADDDIIITVPNEESGTGAERGFAG